MNAPSLPMTRLGDSGLIVSRIGLGLAALGRPGYINLGHSSDLPTGHDVVALEARTHAVLDAAYARGVRYYDAARSYGKAELFLESWLRSRAIDPGVVTIGTKWGYTYTAGWSVEAVRHEVKDHSFGTLMRQAAETSATLGAWVDLYQIHSASLESGVLEDLAVLDRLSKFRAERGWKIGLTLTGPDQSSTLRRALEIEIDGARLFDAVQATWNLLETSAEPALAEAHARGLGVIVKEPLANGQLTTRNDSADFAASRAILQAEAERLGTSLDALALAAALAKPWADVVLSGASTVDHLTSNFRALDVLWDDQAGANLSKLAETPEVYWTRRSTLPWN